MACTVALARKSSEGHARRMMDKLKLSLCESKMVETPGTSEAKMLRINRLRGAMSSDIYLQRSA
eukprot:377226-Hanusia_phi.AAC.1